MKLKRTKSLGVKVSVIASLMAFLLGMLTSGVLTFFFTRTTVMLTHSSVDTANLNIIREVDIELERLAFLSKTVIAHGMTDDVQQMAEWWENDKRDDSDFNAVVAGGKIVWISKDGVLPADFTPSTGMHEVNNRLICTYLTEDQGGYSFLVGTDISNAMIVDEVKSRTQCEIAIFQQNRCYNTTFNEGTEGFSLGNAMMDEAWDAIKTGTPYESRIKVGADTYFTHFEPMKDSLGDIIGAYFVGYPANEYFARLARTVTISYIVVFVLTGVIITLIFRIMRKNVTKPVKALIPICNDIRDINLFNAPPKFKYKDDEIGILAEELIESKETLGTYAKDIVTVLAYMADGDFSKKPDIEYAGDFTFIHDAFDKIHNDLGSIISYVASSSENVSDGAEQISNASTDLAEGAKLQASAVEKLSSAISMLSYSVGQNADNSQKASQLSMECSDIMSEQTEKMKRLIRAMDEVEKKTAEIEKINKTIEDIAFQTNILALNASIEAAHAGETGKGFLVIASKVSTLAAMSSDAVNSTREIIDIAVKAISESSKIAHEAADATETVTAKSSKSASLVKEIAKESSSQAMAINQSASEINEISTVIQLNSDTAEQSADSCRELSSHAMVLQEQISKLSI